MTIVGSYDRCKTCSGHTVFVYYCIYCMFNYISYIYIYIDVSKNSGTPKSSILIGFSIINHPFWGTTILGNTHISLDRQDPLDGQE